MNLSMIGHILGTIGMTFVVIAFYQLVHEKWQSNQFIYNWVNLMGALMLFVSLLIHFNLGSFIIEIFWIVISIQGIIKSLKGK